MYVVVVVYGCVPVGWHVCVVECDVVCVCLVGCLRVHVIGGGCGWCLCVCVCLCGCCVVRVTDWVVSACVRVCV